MGVSSKGFLSNILDKITNTLNLNAKKILKWYSVVLLIAPILYAVFIQITFLKSKQTIPQLMAKSPGIAESVIVAIIDFLIGYYCLINYQKILADQRGYRTFMICQMLCQMCLGNFVCFILAALGAHAANEIETNVSSQLRLVNLISTILLVGCVILSIMIGIRG